MRFITYKFENDLRFMPAYSIGICCYFFVYSIKKMLYKLFFFISIVTLSSCFVNTKNFPAPHELKVAIAKSIKIPFPETDTVLYDAFIGICGNSSQDELNRYYEPHLDKKPYNQILEDNYHGTIWYSNQAYYDMIDSLYEGFNTPKGFMENAIHFKLTGDALTNKTVKITERYYFKDSTHIIQKIFFYQYNAWDYTIKN